MNEIDYNARLYEKMKAEQDKYRDWLLHQEPPEILNHTYNTAAKADKEADRAEPALSKEKSKTPEPNRQTVHTQPKKHKKSKER